MSYFFQIELCIVFKPLLLISIIVFSIDCVELLHSYWSNRNRSFFEFQILHIIWREDSKAIFPLFTTASKYIFISYCWPFSCKKINIQMKLTRAPYHGRPLFDKMGLVHKKRPCSCCSTWYKRWRWIGGELTNYILLFDGATWESFSCLIPHLYSIINTDKLQVFTINTHPNTTLSLSILSTEIKLNGSQIQESSGDREALS